MQTRVSTMHRMRGKVSSRRKQGGWTEWIGPVVSAVASLAGGAQTNAANANLNETNRNWNSAEAALNRDFQSRGTAQAMAFANQMSSTSYQRAVKDMEKAGLNPMLAYSQGGASTPSVAAPQGSTATTAAPIPAINKIALATHAAQQAVQTQNMMRQGENIEADTLLKQAQANRESNTAANVFQQTEKLVTGEIPKIREEINLLQRQNITEQARFALTEAQTLLTKTQQMVQAGTISKVAAETDLIKVNKLLKDYEVNEAKAISDKFGTEFGHDVSPFLRDAITILRALTRGR